MSFFLFMIILAIVVWSNRLRFEKLEAEVRQLRLEIRSGGDTAPRQTQGSRSQGSVQQDEAMATPDLAPYPAWIASSTARVLGRGEADSPGRLQQWLRENWLLAIGALFMLLAVGWLVRFAFMNGYIGPVGRIIMGLTLGAGIMAIAQRRIATHLQQGSIFAVLGSALILLTTYAGQKFYGLFPAGVSIAVMLASAALVAFMSVRYRAPRLAYAGLLLAAVVPVLASTGSKDFIGLFSYLAVISAGSIWVALVTGWRKVVLYALAVVSAYSIVVTGSSSLWLYQKEWLGLGVAFAFAAVFFVVTLLSSRGAAARQGFSDMATAMLLVLYIILWVSIAPADHLHGMMLTGWALVFGYGAYAHFLMLQSASARSKAGADAPSRDFFYVYAGSGLALLAAATAVEFNGHVRTIAFIVEAALLPPLAFAVLKSRRAAARAALFILLPTFLALQSLDRRWPEDVLFHGHFFVTLLMAAASAGLAWYLLRLPEDARAEKDAGPDDARPLIIGLNVVIATVYGCFLVWNTLHAQLADDDTAKTIALTLFMLAGLAAYIGGHARAIRPVKIYGGIMIGWVSFRLLFIDMPGMGASGRIVTFFILGALLLGTAFIEHKNKKGAKK